MSETIDFALNYQYITEVNITPNDDDATWAWVGPGITTNELDSSEEQDETAYYDGGGVANTSVTGVTMKRNVSGYRKFGDPFQDWVASLQRVTGSGRDTQYRVTAPTGECVEIDCTILDIKADGPSGDANAKQDFSCTIAESGTPRVVTEAAGTSLPRSVTLSPKSGVTISEVGGTATVSATVSPSTASGRCLYAMEDESIATVDSEGTVTGVAAGTTRLVAKCAAKPSVQAIISVTVSDASTSA